MSEIRVRPSVQTDIKVLSRTQRIVVNPVDRSVSIVKAGPIGPGGPRGLIGPKGDQGDRGIQGLKGDQGDRGIQGLKGDQGDRGIQGFDGDPGPQNLFVQPSDPGMTSPGMWIQTGLGTGGTDFSIWIEDGV